MNEAVWSKSEIEINKAEFLQEEAALQQTDSEQWGQWAPGTAPRSAEGRKPPGSGPVVWDPGAGHSEGLGVGDGQFLLYLTSPSPLRERENE